MKKQLLIVTLFCFNQNSLPKVYHTGTVTTPVGNFSARTELSDKTVAYALCTIVAAKILYDVSWHNQYSNSVNNWYQTANNFIDDYRIQSVTDQTFKKIQHQIDVDEVLQYHVWIDNSYNNWLCPWNWTETQKTALIKCQAIATLILYADIIADGTLTDQEIIQKLQSKFITTSIYPLVQSGIMLDNTLQFISSNRFDCCSPKIIKLLKELKPFLISYKNILRSSKDYIQEMQTKKTHDLQKELIQATRASGY